MSRRIWLPGWLMSAAVAWSLGAGTWAAAQPPAPPPAVAPVDSSAPADGNISPSPEPRPTTSLSPSDDSFLQWEVVSIDNIFTASWAEGYYAPDSTVGSIIAIPDLYLPATVNTVTRDMIRDQQALSFSDILRDIGGAVQSNGGLAPTGQSGLHADQFLLRGLEVTQFNFRKNGFLDPTYTPRDFANVERIDVLKGPASALYGAAQPAGTVNLVTKQAQAEQFAWGGMTYGSHGLQRYQFDANSTNAEGDLLVRVNGAYQDVNSFRNFGYNERTFIAPVVTKLYGGDTALTWEGEYHKDRRMVDSGLIAVNGNTRAFADDILFGAPTDFAEFHDYRSTWSLTHRFNDWWQLYIGQTSLFYDAPSRSTIPQTGFTTTLTPEGFYAGAAGLGGLLNRAQYSATNVQEQNHGLIANLSGEIDGPLFTHNLLLGTEANWFIVNNNQFSTSIPGLDPALTFDPSSGAQPFPGATPVNASFDFDNPGYYQNRFGIYLQDVMQVTDSLTLMGGLRWDTLRVQYDRSLLFGGFPVFAPAPSEEFYDRWSPRAGAVYELVPGTMSAYGLYTESFSPPGRNIYAAAPLQPETGRMWEGGVKTNLYENLALTVGGFYIERDNIAVQITNFNVAHAAEQQSKGVELNLVGQWTEQLSIVSNYTYADVEQFGPTGFNALNGRVRGVPFGSGNVWTRYDVIQTADSTWGLGLGYVHVGERRGDYTTPLRLPSYSRWDLGLFGQQGRWDLGAYVENVFDVRYETGAISQYQIYPGAPANFRLQVGANF